MRLFHSIQNKRFIIPLVFLGVVLVTYGYQLTRMGLYWDDWEIIYLDHFNNPKAYWDYFLYARPLTSWLYLLLGPIVGMRPIAWQITNILLRWLGMVGFWWAFRMVWPKRSFEIGWICLLLAIYPAFTQHSVALTYSRHFACIALFSVSLGLNLLAIHNPKRWWVFTGLAVFASLLQLITLEYFFGWELIRPILIWIYLQKRNQDWKSNLKTLMVQWFPYVIVLLIFGGYRFIWYPLVSPNPEANAPVLFERLSSNPIGETIKFANLILQDLIHLNIDNWLAPIDPDAFELKAKANWLSWGSAALITVICAWLLIRTTENNDENQNEKDGFCQSAILIGLIAVLAGGVPVWITGRQSIGGPWADRFALGPMLGAVILLTGCIYWFASRRFQQTLLLGLIFGFALSAQMQTVNKYRLSWDNQRDFYWQLAWRAPAIKPGTAVIAPSMPFALVNDLHIGFALNTIYDQGGKSFEAPLWFFREGGLVGDLIPALKPGVPIDYKYLTAHFQGTTDQILAIDYSYGTTCLHVATEEDLYRKDLSSDARKLVKLGKPEFIETKPQRASIPPVTIFGPEPVHGWCYLYQKMEIARQENDWNETARLADEASAKGMTPKSYVEYTPSILAYLHTGQYEKALDASRAAQSMNSDQSMYICSLWKNNKAMVSDESVFTSSWKTMQCDVPAETEAQ